MDLVNERVSHQKFGSGKITDQTETTVTVEFDKEYGIKKFVYPSALETYLLLSNPIIKQGMDDEMQEIRVQEELKRQQIAEEEERRQKELLEQKRKAKKKTTSKKKTKAKTK